MSLRLQRSAASRQDIRSIWSYIANDNRLAAERFAVRIEELMNRLAEVPEIGRLRPELRKGMRSISIGRYVVFYEHDSEVVRLLRVMHGARDITADHFPEDE